MSATEPHEGITGVTFDSDGHRLVGVQYLARGEEPKPTVLLLHGCPGLEQNLDLAVRLRDRGWNSLMFHYRGCWGSAGRYDLRTIPRDVTAALDYLAGGPAVDPGRIAVVGHSLGGWAALVTAAAEPRLRAVAVYGAATRLGGTLALDPAQVEQELTRFLAATPQEFAIQRTWRRRWTRWTPRRRSSPGRCWWRTAPRTGGSRWRRPASWRREPGRRAGTSRWRGPTTPSPGTGRSCGT